MEIESWVVVVATKFRHVEISPNELYYSYLEVGLRELLLLALISAYLGPFYNRFSMKRVQ